MIKIVTDSTSALPKDYVEEHGIYVVPLKVAFGDEVYRDGVDIFPDMFFKKIKETGIFPKTSQPSVEEFYQTYSDIFNKYPDVEGVISIHISSGLSGTIGSANSARELLPEYKEKIYIIDSKITEFALGLIIIQMVRAIEKGMSLKELLDFTNKMLNNTEVLFTVDTLEYLYRGGRIGAAQAWMGSILQIKPILELKNGIIEPVERVRTKQKVKDRILEIMKERVGDVPVITALAYSDNYEEVKEISEEVKKKFNVLELFLASFSCTILSHIGPGSWGIICLKGE
ncbi:MAG: fatty acid-binding protein DegV [Dictyoglomus sp. NZ13-RE01]|nr:MAG: fatty acid-binding protein DegV [Dictyoglomus sp. NZ13-RE01]